MATPAEQLKQLEAQQAATVEAIRNVLMGRWDDARVWVDSIDPNRAGSWTNEPFPKG